MKTMNNRTRSPFWRRANPSPEHDITLLRPASLPRGKRFETIGDARLESWRSEQLLGPGPEAETLAECSCGDCRCQSPSCPICARLFRRWFIGELLRLAEAAQTPSRIFTILLEAADRNKINRLDPARYRHMLRKRLQRAGLGNVVVIGAFELVYRAQEWRWILHINLVIIGGSKGAIQKFKRSFKGSELDRPVHDVGLCQLPEQLSYVLKFCTYHRPYPQRGSAKGRALPLNRSEHLALVQWMNQREFKDNLFLFNASRQGSSIIPSRRAPSARQYQSLSSCEYRL